MMYAARAADSFISSSKTWLQAYWLVCAARVVALPGSREPASEPRGDSLLQAQTEARPPAQAQYARVDRVKCIFQIFCGCDAQAYFTVMN